jgi:hypothetical protein
MLLCAAQLTAFSFFLHNSGSSAYAQDGLAGVKPMVPNQTKDLFKKLWSSRFDGFSEPNVLQYDRHLWTFDRHVEAAFPTLTAVLKLSVSYRVDFEVYGTRQSRIACFRMLEADRTLSWLLHVPKSSQRGESAMQKLPSMSLLWKYFEGFDNVNPIKDVSPELPCELSEINAFLTPRVIKLPADDRQFFGEMCDDLAFLPRLKRMFLVGHDSAGNFLVAEADTEQMFYLCMDGDWFGRRGCETGPIGDGETSVYSLKRTPILAKLLEACGEHILNQLPNPEQREP